MMVCLWMVSDNHEEPNVILNVLATNSLSVVDLLFEALKGIVNSHFKESPRVLQGQLREINIVHNKQQTTVDAQLVDANLTVTYNLKV
jgi:hypothetical protein